ncbi:SWIM zinc finger family protein [Candidatus Aerophobetes bacterium]|nr:SWIM zinc finger family protein [Candidatus Aerophobetes bacterium]
MARRKAFGTTWWARKWIEALEVLGSTYSNRLPRGRTYARQGRVVDLKIIPGAAVARVQGTRRVPYRVQIKLRALTDKQWKRVIKVLAKEAIFAAKLLNGEMPSDIDDVFKRCGLSLFPTTATELETSCSCPDWANPCKHIAATHYILAQAFNHDPFLLFELRGWKKDRVLRELRAARSLEDLEEKESPSFEEQIHSEKIILKELDEEKFTCLKTSLDDIHFHITSLGEFTILKRLGPLPEEGNSGEFTKILEEIYKSVSDTALKTILSADENVKRFSP